jgi:hypothetical protein
MVAVQKPDVAHSLYKTVLTEKPAVCNVSMWCGYRHYWVRRSFSAVLWGHACVINMPTVEIKSRYYMDVT